LNLLGAGTRLMSERCPFVPMTPGSGTFVAIR
jgi:hypothetical protein